MQHLDAAYHLLTDENIQLLYPINVIRSFLIAVSITRHGDLTLQIALIGYYSFMRMQNRLSLRAVGLSLHSTFIRQHLQRIGRIRVPEKADYRLILNTDDTEYGGYGAVEGIHYPWQDIGTEGQTQSIQFYVPA